MWRIQGSGLPAWIRFLKNQNAETVATPPTNTQNAFQRRSRDTTNGIPIANATTTPQIVNLLPNAIPIARPATRMAPNGGAAGGGPEGELSPITGETVRGPFRGSIGVPPGPPSGVGPSGRDSRAAQALIRIAAAAKSIATGTVSVAGVPASRGTIGPVSIAIATAVSESGATPYGRPM